MNLKASCYQSFVENRHSKHKFQHNISFVCCDVLSPCPQLSLSSWCQLSTSKQSKIDKKTQNVYQFIQKQNFSPNKIINEQKQESYIKLRNVSSSLIYCKQFEKKKNQLKKIKNVATESSKIIKQKTDYKGRINMHFIESKKYPKIKIQPIVKSFENLNINSNKLSNNQSSRQQKVIDQSTITAQSLNLSLKDSLSLQIKLQNLILPKTPRILQKKQLFKRQNISKSFILSKDTPEQMGLTIRHLLKEIQILDNQFKCLQQEQEYLIRQQKYQLQYFKQKSHQFQLQKHSWEDIIYKRQQQIQQLKKMLFNFKQKCQQ